MGCDSPRIPILWKTYEHPSYQFSLRIPRSWETKSDGLGGAAVVFLASETDTVFRANLNVVVQDRRTQLNLEQISVMAAEQLKFVLNEYELLARAKTRLGSFDAFELRGRYAGPEGRRIIRTFIAVTDSVEYVVTFGAREEREPHFQKAVRAIVDSFQVNQGLRQ